MQVYGLTSYSTYTDEELIIERDRQREHLDELTLHPDPLPSVGQLLTGIEREIQRLTEELLRRARSTHSTPRSLDTQLRFRPGRHRQEK